MERSSGRLRHLAAVPLTWHLASLVIGAVVILALQGSQWFFFDEWAFLKYDGPGYLDPHVGHWSTSPMLVFHAIRDGLGLGSYAPFAVAVTLVHLAVAHLTWRLAIRAGADAWVATAAVAVLVVLGSGAENILWGFQIGFLGALALGLASFLIVTSPHVSWRRLVAAIAVAVFGLTWSGTVIPLVVAAAGLLWHRQGWRKALVYAVSCGAVYLAWYVGFALPSGHVPDTGGLDPVKVFVRIPQFLGVMLLLGWDSVFPLYGIGVAALLALAWWLVRLWRRKERLAHLSVALLLLGGAVVFALITAYSRAQWSIGAGRSSRYIYVLVVLLLPLCAVALTRLVRSRERRLVGVCAALVLLAGFQTWKLVGEADRQATLEAHSQALISAAITLHAQDPASVDLTRRPDPEWAPDVTLADVLRLHESGALPVGPFSEAELEEARMTVGAGGE